jgi:hypothetical protein
MVRATGQPGTHPAARQAVISRLPSPAILDEHDILQRAAEHFRLRSRGDLDAVISADMPPPPEKLGTVTGFSRPAASGGNGCRCPRKTGDCP